MTPKSFVGIGPAFSNINGPKRRLEIHDDGLTLGNTLAADPKRSQLRITQTLDMDTMAGKGVWTEFLTTGVNNEHGKGKMLINPRFYNSANNSSIMDTGYVGINMYDTLANTNRFKKLSLDVNGQQNLRWVNRNDSLVYVLVWDSAANGRIMRRKIDLLGIGSCNAPTILGGNGGAINLNNTDNFHFLGNNSGNLAVNNVMIGATPGCIIPRAKLHVVQNANAPSSVSILSENLDTSSTFAPTVGIKSRMVTDQNCSSIAAWLEAPSNNMAICQPYALFVPFNGGRISINYPYNDPAAIPWMFALNGAANSPVGWFNISDQMFKKNIDTISNPLDKVNKINGVYFEFDTLNYPTNNFPSGKQIGFIAQNVDTILPEAVSNYGGPLSMDYAKITPLLLEAIKALNKKVDALETQLNQCCQNNNMNNNKQNNNGGSNNTQTDELSNTINVELSNGDAIVLEQNVPNPFNENTSIKYYIPENINYAQIIFTDMHGRIIKTVDINQTGHGQLKVYAANLSQGIYQYSILVDGKVIETKKMVVEK